MDEPFPLEGSLQPLSPIIMEVEKGGFCKVATIVAGTHFSFP